MTDNEIEKALVCHSTGDVETCLACPLRNRSDCAAELSRCALDLINRLKLENEDLKSQIKNHELEAELAWEREVMLDDR